MLEKNFFQKTQKGFTLLEIIVSMSLFSVTMIVATQIFQLIMQGQHNTIASQNIQENFRFAVEMMSKEMRNAQYPLDNPGDECFSGSPQDDDNVFSALRINNDSPVGAGNKGTGIGYKLIFKNKYGECVKYYLDDTSNSIKVVRKTSAYTKEYPITPQNIKVTAFTVSVHDNSVVDDFSDYKQPTATINFTAEVNTNKETSKNKINIQTTVSARAYNRY